MVMLSLLMVLLTGLVRDIGIGAAPDAAATAAIARVFSLGFIGRGVVLAFNFFPGEMLRSDGRLDGRGGAGEEVGRGVDVISIHVRLAFWGIEGITSGNLWADLLLWLFHEEKRRRRCLSE